LAESGNCSDWSQAARLENTQSLIDYWEREYDWRRFESELNRFPQFLTEIDGLDFHFIHVKSKNPNAMPLISTHGWPGSIVEFLKLIGPLTDPVAFEGHVDDSFDVVVPSLPGFGFSQKPTETGWNIVRIATAWAELRKRLGYENWAAHGGDWGSAITTVLGAMRPDGLRLLAFLRDLSETDIPATSADQGPCGHRGDRPHAPDRTGRPGPAVPSGPSGCSSGRTDAGRQGPGPAGLFDLDISSPRRRVDHPGRGPRRGRAGLCLGPRRRTR
jgi:pimeloyl-ACP methyl ester carboxylesterase